MPLVLRGAMDTRAKRTGLLILAEPLAGTIREGAAVQTHDPLCIKTDTDAYGRDG